MKPDTFTFSLKRLWGFHYIHPDPVISRFVETILVIITNSTKQNLWAAGSHSAAKGIPHFLLPGINYSVLNSLFLIIIVLCVCDLLYTSKTGSQNTIKSINILTLKLTAKILYIISAQKNIPKHERINRPRWSSGSMLATGPKVRGFKPSQGWWICKGDKNP
jgi:hypothetical protein